jgi:hypothetical protein
MTIEIMENRIGIREINGIRIAEVISEGLVIRNIQDGLDLMGDVYFQGFDRMILHEKNITPEFFDLKTRMAGEILQKFSNYRIRLSIVGDFSKYTRKSIRDFIFESNKMGQISFVGSVEEARERLIK